MHTHPLSQAEQYWLLAGLFTPPQWSQWQELAAVMATTDPLPPHLAAIGANLTDQALCTQAQVDYVRLFVLNPQASIAPLYASYWLEQQLFGSNYQKLQQLITSCGLTLKPQEGLTLDHLVSELEFLAFIIENQDLPQAQRQQSEAWLRQHLNAWLPAFIAHSRPLAEQTFYASVLNLLEFSFPSPTAMPVTWMTLSTAHLGA